MHQQAPRQEVVDCRSLASIADARSATSNNYKIECGGNIHNEVKQNLLKSKTTMKRMKSNVRRARELNESDEEDLDIDVHEVSLCMTLVSPAPNTQTSNTKYQINTLLLTTTTTTTTMTDWLLTRAGGEGRRTGVRAQGRGGRGGRRGVY